MSELRSRWVTSIETPAVEGHVCDPAVAMAWKYRGLKTGPTNIANRDTFGIVKVRDLCSRQLGGCTIQVSCTVEMHPWIKLHSHYDGSTGADIGGSA